MIMQRFLGTHESKYMNEDGVSMCSELEEISIDNGIAVNRAVSLMKRVAGTEDNCNIYNKDNKHENYYDKSNKFDDGVYFMSQSMSTSPDFDPLIEPNNNREKGIMFEEKLEISSENRNSFSKMQEAIQQLSSLNVTIAGASQRLKPIAEQYSHELRG